MSKQNGSLEEEKREAGEKVNESEAGKLEPGRDKERWTYSFVHPKTNKQNENQNRRRIEAKWFA